MATTYIVTGVDTGIPSLPNDSVLTGLKVGDTFTTTLDSGVEAELIAAGLIAKSPLSSPVVMQSDGTLAAKDGRSFSGGSGGSVAPLRLVDVVSMFFADMPLSPPSGPATVDGFAVVDGTRVLLGNQSARIDSGIWVANTAGNWTRPADWATGSLIPDGTLISVGETAGSSFYQSLFALQGAATVGTDGEFFSWLAGLTGLNLDANGAGKLPKVELSGSLLQIVSQAININLPTADPHVVGQLWNNAGVVTVSAG